MREPVYKLLDDLNIKYKVSEHPAVFTVEEADKLRLDKYGKGTKNLFLRDKKEQNFYILVLCNEKRADLKEVRVKLDSKPLSLASEESLWEILKLRRGAVTPFGVINDVERKVQVVFDEDIFKFDRVVEHPNENTATLWLDPYDLKKAIEKLGNATKVIAV